MSTYRLHARGLPRRNSEIIAGNAATDREAKRQRDRELLEGAWRRMTAPSPRCTRCANLAPGTRCTACLVAAVLPRVRP